MLAEYFFALLRYTYSEYHFDLSTTYIRKIETRKYMYEILNVVLNSFDCYCLRQKGTKNGLPCAAGSPKGLYSSKMSVLRSDISLNNGYFNGFAYSG